jgi:hypothetical protein
MLVILENLQNFKHTIYRVQNIISKANKVFFVSAVISSYCVSQRAGWKDLFIA